MYLWNILFKSSVCVINAKSDAESVKRDSAVHLVAADTVWTD